MRVPQRQTFSQPAPLQRHGGFEAGLASSGFLCAAQIPFPTLWLTDDSSTSVLAKRRIRTRGAPTDLRLSAAWSGSTVLQKLVLHAPPPGGGVRTDMQDKDCVHSTRIPQTHLASCWGWYEAAGSLRDRKGDWRAILGKKFSQFSPNHRASPFFFSNMRCVLPPVIPLCRSGT